MDDNQHDPIAFAERLQRYIEKCRRMVAEHGHIIQSVPGAAGTPSFSYSVGLTLKRRPEFIVIGFEPGLASAVINGIAKLSEDQEITVGADIEGLASVPIRVRELPLELAMAHCRVIAPVLGQTPDRILQIIWPDTRGHFPHEPEYRHLIRQSLDELTPNRAS